MAPCSSTAWELKQSPVVIAGSRRRKIPRSPQRVLLKELSQGSEWQTRVMTGEPGALVIRVRQKEIKGREMGNCLSGGSLCVQTGVQSHGEGQDTNVLRNGFSSGGKKKKVQSTKERRNSQWAPCLPPRRGPRFPKGCCHKRVWSLRLLVPKTPNGKKVDIKVYPSMWWKVKRK